MISLPSSKSSLLSVFTVALVVAWIRSSTANAFTATTTITATRTTTRTSSSSLHISSWGVKGNPAFRTKQKLDPEKHIQDYLPEPGPVEARSTINGTILVSGVVNDPDRTDQFLFDLINHEESAFEYTNITAFVNDEKIAKKRLLSRSARYTGLLDKLSFCQANDANALPTIEQLQNINTWLAIVENKDGNNNQLVQQCEEITKLALKAALLSETSDNSCSKLQNVAIVLAGMNELSIESCKSIVDNVQKLKNVNIQYTIVGTGHLDDQRAEGMTAYQYVPMDAMESTLPNKATFSREEMYRLVTELLQLECGSNTAYVFAEVYNPNVTEAKLIKGLREAGYARPQEIDHMIRLGPKAYQEAIEAFRTENPDAALGYTTDAWWEADEYKLSRQRSDERMAATVQAVKDASTVEIEAIAKEWAKREYFRASMAGTVENDMTEEEYIKSVWDRAMFEGDIKFRQSKGETVDTTMELATFQAQQERKQQVMLRRAKAELAQVLQDDSDGDGTTSNKKSDDDDEDDEDDDE